MASACPALFPCTLGKVSLEVGQHVATGHLLQGFLVHFALGLLLMGTDCSGRLASPPHPAAEASSLPRFVVPHRPIAQIPHPPLRVKRLEATGPEAHRGVSISRASWAPAGDTGRPQRWRPVTPEYVSRPQNSPCAHTLHSFCSRKTQLWPRSCWFLQLGGLMFFFFK